MIGKCRIIKHDLFDIVRRIKEIDKSYFVVYNYFLSRFEVHSDNQAGSSFCLALAHKALDARAVEQVRLTRIERSEQLFKSLEEQNQRLKRAQLDLAKERALENAQNLGEFL